MVRPLIVANFSRKVGGGEIGLVELAKGLQEQNIEPLIALPGPGSLAEGLPRVILPAWIGGQAWGIRRLLRTSNLVHATGARGLIAAALARASSPSSCPIIWHVRVADSDPLDPVLEQLPDMIIANSHATTKRFKYARDVRVIYNGILVPERSGARLVAQRGGKRVGVIARMTPEKGHLDFLPAMLDILAHRPDVEFVFAGNDQGKIGDRISEIAYQHSDRVTLLGEVHDIANHIYEFDLVVVPSRIEGFGRVAVEALMSGVTVAATRVGGLVEVLEGLDDLFLPDDKAQWSDKILTLLDHPPYPPEVLEKFGNRFNFETHVAAFKSIYLELVAGEKAPD